MLANADLPEFDDYEDTEDFYTQVASTGQNYK